MIDKPAEAASGGGIHQVFVYGTLKRGFPNHPVMGISPEHRGSSRVSGYVMLDLGAFPGIVRVPNGGWHAYGEIYRVSDAVFARLDALEGYPRFYGREIVDLPYHGKTWVYVLPQSYLKDGAAFLPVGRWGGPGAYKAYQWDSSKMENPHLTNRPLLEYTKPSCEAKGRIVPERTPEDTKVVPTGSMEARIEKCQVGPGVEEAAPHDEEAA